MDIIRLRMADNTIAGITPGCIVKTACETYHVDGDYESSLDIRPPIPEGTELTILGYSWEFPGVVYLIAKYDDYNYLISSSRIIYVRRF